MIIMNAKTAQPKEKSNGVSMKCAQKVKESISPAQGEKPRIGLDIDDTVAATKLAAIASIRDKGGSVEMEQLVTPFLENHVVGITLTEAEIKGILMELWKNNSEQVQLLDPKIPEILKSIKEHYDISITTATDADDETLTKWLVKNGIPFDEIIHVESSSKKLDASSHIDVFIDDFPKVVDGAAKRGKIGILIKQKWNEEYRKGNTTDNPNVIHANDWPHIQELLTELLRKE